MKKKNTKNTNLVILFILAIVLVVFGTVSFAKYQFGFNEQYIGHYVDYRISHDGEGRSAILENVNTTKSEDNSYSYNYVGHVVLQVSNVLDGKVSQRDVKFSLRTPTLEEINNGVEDAWKNEYPVEATSTNFEVELVDSKGAILSTTSDEYKNLTEFEERIEKTSYLNLVIRRRTTNKSGSAVSQFSNMERITIVLETSEPYKDLQVFNIVVADNLIMMSTIESHYFGFEQVELDIKTSKLYEINDGGVEKKSFNPVKIELNISNLTFDYERFRLSVENNYVELANENAYTTGYYLTRTAGVISKVTLFVPSGSELKLYFYKEKSSGLKITTNVTFDITSPSTSADYVYTSYVAGVTNGVVYNK